MATTLSWETGSLVLDATPSQSHALDFELTDHPIETGGVVTDHLRHRPRELKLEGVLSPQDTEVAEDSSEPRPETAEDIYRELSALMRAGTLFVVQTSLERYDSMFLVSLAVPRDAGSGDALRFSATFRQVVFADSQRVQVEIPSAKQNRGRQATTKTDAQTEKKAKKKAKRASAMKTISRSASRLVGGG